jgi:hypothetical protein
VDPFVELASVVDALNAAQIDYALCGAVAVAVHGAPRATQDIDVLVRANDVARVRHVARAIGFTLESHPMKFSSGFTVHRVIKMIGTQPFMLDLIEANEWLTAIFDARQTIRAGDRDMMVVSRDGLITMKLAAGRPQDVADVQRLQELDRG